MAKKYRRYYAHWRDFDLLLAIFAMTGLIIALATWEQTFLNDHLTGEESIREFAVQVINVFLFFIAMICISLRQYMRSFWKYYNEPKVL